jgi:hypothetical protein
MSACAVTRNNLGLAAKRGATKPIASEVAILPSTMSVFGQKRAWFWIAFAAILIALVGFTVLNVHGDGPDQPLWLVLLPVFFVGLIAPLGIVPLIALLSLGHASEAPALAASFQRPPPSHHILLILV